MKSRLLSLKTVGLVVKHRHPGALALRDEVIAWLEQRGIAASELELTGSWEPIKDYNERAKENLDLIIVLGGDGTLIATARKFSGEDVPLFAVNFGGLGFMTDTSATDVYRGLEAILAGKVHIDERAMLHCHLKRGSTAIMNQDVLNDVVVNKGVLARLIEMEVLVDGTFVTALRADGLIISTPTGSTAYCLAAGGPVMAPSVEAFVIVPICAHSLTNRPLVVPFSSTVEIRVTTGEGIYLTLDGQVGQETLVGDDIEISVSPRKVHLVRTHSVDFYRVLREKLLWGER